MKRGHCDRLGHLKLDRCMEMVLPIAQTIDFKHETYNKAHLYRPTIKPSDAIVFVCSFHQVIIPLSANTIMPWTNPLPERAAVQIP